MKPLSTLLCGLALLSTVTIAQAAAPAAKPADKTPPAPAAPATIMDAYVVELTDKVQLTDAEKKQIEGIYTADGVALKKILNDDSLSAILKAGQVADLRDERNKKIDVVLAHDLDREKAFFEVEAAYRVSLTEFAANGGLVPPAPEGDKSAAPTPAPATVPSANTAAPAKKDAGTGPTSTSATPSKPAATTPPPANAPVATPPPM